MEGFRNRFQIAMLSLFRFNLFLLENGHSFYIYSSNDSAGHLVHHSQVSDSYAATSDGNTHYRTREASTAHRCQCAATSLLLTFGTMSNAPAICKLWKVQTNQKDAAPAAAVRSDFSKVSTHGLLTRHAHC